MTKATATLITVIAGLLAVAVPILIALHIAYRQGKDFETTRVLGYAKDALHRSDRASDQIRAGIDRLVKAGAVDPCSEAQIALMRDIDLASSYIQAIGHVSGNKLVCSSLGFGSTVQFDLGPPDVVTSTGSAVRTNVVFTSAQKISYTVVERAGYAVIIHKDLPIDVSASIKDLSLATITPDNRKVRSSRGVFKVAWMDALGPRKEVTFVEDHYVVAAVRSDRYATVVLAALPIQHVDARTRSAALVLVPAGLAASAVLIWAILYVMRQQLAMPAALKLALRRKEFFLVYQPVVDLQTGQWVGAEALIRWRRPNGEMVPPDQFIQVAEDTGLIQRVTEHVVHLISRDAAGIFERHPAFHLGINLSASDMQSKRTVELLGRLVEHISAGCGNLIVEATERGFMNADVAREMVQAIRDRGIHVAVDDFGTGYSSLSYLETFELDYLKIDKSFVDKINTEAATSQVVSHIIEMAKGLRLKMVAEGVETDAQAQFLRDRGVQYAQGWLFSKPLAFGELQAQLAEHGAECYPIDRERACA